MDRGRGRIDCHGGSIQRGERSFHSDFGGGARQGEIPVQNVMDTISHHVGVWDVFLNLRASYLDKDRVSMSLCLYDMMAKSHSSRTRSVDCILCEIWRGII